MAAEFRDEQMEVKIVSRAEVKFWELSIGEVFLNGNHLMIVTDCPGHALSLTTGKLNSIARQQPVTRVHKVSIKVEV